MVNLYNCWCHLNRDQLTTTEVNMARVFNWDVKRRQALGLAGKAK